MSFYSFMRKIAYPFIKVIYPTKFIGKANFPKDGKAVILSNHYSMADVIVVCVGLIKKDFNGLSKKELYKNKLIGGFLKKLGGIPIDREGSDIGAIKNCVKALSSGKKLFICPEGTRNKGDYKKMLPLKTGSAVVAIKTKTPITLLLINKKPRAFRKNYILVSKPFELTEFYTDKSPDMKERSTQLLEQKFTELRLEMEKYLSLSKKERKEYENNCCK